MWQATAALPRQPAAPLRLRPPSQSRLRKGRRRATTLKAAKPRVAPTSLDIESARRLMAPYTRRLLTSNAVFQDLSPEQLEKVVELLHCEVFADGTIHTEASDEQCSLRRLIPGAAREGSRTSSL